jgi:hypothetical protein
MLYGGRWVADRALCRSMKEVIENFRRQSADGLSIVFIVIWLAGDVFNILGNILSLAQLSRPFSRFVWRALYQYCVGLSSPAPMTSFENRKPSSDFDDDLLAGQAVLQLPNNPFSFKLAFESNYPDSQPTIKGVHSVARGQGKGNGKRAEDLLAHTLKRVFTQGQVYLFDLIEEALQALGRPHQESDDDRPKDEANPTTGADSEQECGDPQPEADTCTEMYAALIRTHHITSRKK